MSSTIVNKPSAVAIESRLVEVAQPSQNACDCGCAGNTPEMDAGLCPISCLTFPRFFAGELVQPADLNAILARVFSHEQLRARHTIGWGVGCGLRVAIDGEADQQTGATLVAGATLRVEAGYGIDRYGRDVYMAADYSTLLAQLFSERQARITKAMGDPWCAVPGCQPTPPTHFCIAVRYKECLSSPVASYAQQCGTPKTICEYSRVSECVEVRLFGDNEFPQIPSQTDALTWCGLPAADAVLARIWNLITQIPHGATDVASTVAAGASASDAPSDVYQALATRVGEAREQESASCTDLLHLARACDPCIPCWPWIPLACFTSDGRTVSAPDCRVRRTIYSLQEIEAAVVRILCIILELVRDRQPAPAPPPPPPPPPPPAPRTRRK